MAIERPWDETGTRRVPAWVMSSALHLLAVLVLGWLWKGAAPRGLGGEPSRQAGIVVAVQSSDGQTEYFDSESEARDDAQQTVTGASPAAPADVLPAMEAVSDLPDIELPGASVTGQVAGNLLEGPNLGVQGAGGLPGANNNALLQRIMAEEAANRPPAPVGMQAPLSLFGSPSVGRSFVFVIDRSKSMGASGLGALSAARNELTGALGKLSPSQRFEIVAYHQAPVTFGQKYYKRTQLTPVDEQSLARVKEFFGGLAAFGSTRHVFALHAALDLRPEVVYLLTDGGDPYPSPAQLRDLSHRAKRTGTAIHCLQFGFGPLQEDENFMMKLSRDNSGAFRYVRMDGGTR